MSLTVTTTTPSSSLDRTALRPLLTAEEVAAILRITPRTVIRFANSGKLPRVKVGPKTTRYTASSVLALIEASTDLANVSPENGPPNGKGPRATAGPAKKGSVDDPDLAAKPA